MAAMFLVLAVPATTVALATRRPIVVAIGPDRTRPEPLIDGGTTDLVNFNQASGGDYADFAPNCGGGGSGEFIQNAFNCSGQDEAYTTSSPEFVMLESIGWDPAIPEPGSLSFTIAALGALAVYRRYRGARACRIPECG